MTMNGEGEDSFFGSIARGEAIYLMNKEGKTEKVSG